MDADRARKYHGQKGMGDIDFYRTCKAYTATEAARLIGTSPSNVRRWLLGYKDRTGKMAPVFGPKIKGEGSLEVSFLELVELLVATGFRKLGIDLSRIRDAHKYACQEFRLPYPFASLKLVEHGGHILHEFDSISRGRETLVVLDMKGQYALPEIVKGRILLLDFHEEDTLAVRWFPYGRDIPIVVDPQFGGGRPTVEGRGLTIEAIIRRRKAGQSLTSIAHDFQLDKSQVATVLKHAA